MAAICHHHAEIITACSGFYPLFPMVDAIRRQAIIEWNFLALLQLVERRVPDSRTSLTVRSGHLMKAADVLTGTLYFWISGFGLAQVTEVYQTAAASSECAAPIDQLRVLPSGFNRSVLQPFTTTSSANILVPVAAELSACQFISFDPAFDQIIGTDRTIFQVGPSKTYNWAHEGATYLPGEKGWYR